MTKKIYFLFVVFMIRFSAEAQNHTVVDIINKSNKAISQFHSGDFNFTYIYVNINKNKFPNLVDTSFASAEFIFFKDSVDDRHIAQFFFKQNNDTAAVYDGKYVYRIDQNIQNINAKKVEHGAFSQAMQNSDIFDLHLIFPEYLEKTNTSFNIKRQGPFDLERIEKIDDIDCFKIINEISGGGFTGQVTKIRNTFFIDTTTYLIKKVIYDDDFGDKHTITEINLSSIHHLKKGEIFKFDVNSLVKSRGYSIKEY